jgi:uncharacterized protein (TIGR03382 family)
MNQLRLALVLTTSLALIDQASAMSNYPSTIPNGSEFSCATCHVNPAGGGERNGFGQAYQSNRSWTFLYSIDCDLDGQTNGQELGDPCGDWSSGQTPGRTTDISNPGDITSTSGSPMVPSCGGTDAGSGLVADAGSDPIMDSGAQDATATLPDRVNEDRPVCDPVCLDLNRLFDCTPSGAHVVVPCPPGHYCEEAECKLGTPDGEREDDDPAAEEGGCGCAGAGGAGGLLGLALLLGLRRRRAGRAPRG